MEDEQTSNEQDLPQHSKEELKKITVEEERRKQWRKEIAENTALQLYFKQFSDSSVAEFIESYLTYKNFWVSHGERYEKDQEYHSIKWVAAATKHFEIIQQKKLFDAQCLWRAEQLQIPEIQICYDFERWGKNVLNCPFIEPITQDDLALYQQYLLNGDPDEDIGWWCGLQWQFHLGLIEAYHNEEDADWDFPQWYSYHNLHRGTAGYMLLPDIRGEKEDDYLGIASDVNYKKHLKENPPAPETNNQTHIHYYDKEHTKYIVENFENKQIQSFYKAYQWSDRNKDLEENLQHYLQILFDADEPAPIVANEDWDVAIRNAAVNYRFKKIIAAMPEAYEQYLMNIEMNIAFPLSDRWKEANEDERKIKLTELILQGRKLSGESEDLNF